jgi:hypothetical protein
MYLGSQWSVVRVVEGGLTPVGFKGFAGFLSGKVHLIGRHQVGTPHFVGRAMQGWTLQRWMPLS